MKKLIFLKISKDIFYLFIGILFSFGIITWTLQAVNYLDFVTQDGHGFKTYFLYSIFNFPKIVHRLIPFAFFITLFLIITNYEKKNELVIFWTNGISKISFANRILLISIILFVFQIIIGGYLSPTFQFKSRMILKESNVNYFSALIKDGKFINAVSGLTIFIEKKREDGSFENIFIDDSSSNITRLTHAKRGKIEERNNIKIFKLFKGTVLNKSNQKINEFKFDEIDINLSKYETNTILVPKIQETSSLKLFKCTLIKKNLKKNNNERNCDLSIINEIDEELIKRFYKPIYIPLIAIICCFLIIFPKNNVKYNLQLRITFLFGIIILILSETTLRFSSLSYLHTLSYFIIPWILFFLTYSFLMFKTKNA